jgi:hypothetical protein
MRNMSFALTAEQVRARRKTVTRRNGWLFAKVGDVVQPVIKSQGLPKGGHVEKIGTPIRFIAVDRVVLGDITPQDVYREGFPNLTPREFVAFYKHANGGRRDQVVTRIAFEYLESPTPPGCCAMVPAECDYPYGCSACLGEGRAPGQAVKTRRRG